MAKQVADSDREAIAQLDMQFHSSLVAGSEILFSSPTRGGRSGGEHQNILDLFEAGDKNGLLKAIQGICKKLLRTSPQPEVFSRPVQTCQMDMDRREVVSKAAYGDQGGIGRTVEAHHGSAFRGELECPP